MGSLLPSKDAKASFSSADIETGVGTVLQNAPLRSLTRVDVFFHLFLLLVVVVVLFSSGFSMLFPADDGRSSVEVEGRSCVVEEDGLAIFGSFKISAPTLLVLFFLVLFFLSLHFFLFFSAALCLRHQILKFFL